jgi:hypothetical protein
MRKYFVLAFLEYFGFLCSCLYTQVIIAKRLGIEEAVVCFPQAACCFNQPLFILSLSKGQFSYYSDFFF